MKYVLISVLLYSPTQICENLIVFVTLCIFLKSLFYISNGQQLIPVLLFSLIYLFQFKYQ